MLFKPKAPAVMSEINVIPMADIMLCLLIIFMVVTPLLGPGVPVDMARVESPVEMPGCERDDAIVVAVTRDGSIYLGARQVSRNEIAMRVRDLITNRQERIVFVKSDGRARYGYVVGVVDEIRAAGVDEIGLLTERVHERPAVAKRRTGV